ncbi:MAG TPA: anti-sigma factor [Burkholderiaceae bacterium]|jgi:anti-sigma factor RsiW
MPMQDDDALSRLIHREAVRHAPPAGLAERIRAELRAAAPSAAPARAAPALPWRRWLEAVLVFGAGAAVTALVLLNVALPGAIDRTGDEIAAGHVRSLLDAHLTDVASTDRHTVKPWFAGKLDYSPPVQDLADLGYPLIGGRLDVVHQRPVAALVYRDHQHVINVFVWPASEHTGKAESLQGFSLVAWSQGGMQFWAVSDAAPQELQAFSQALRTRIDAAAPA